MRLELCCNDLCKKLLCEFYKKTCSYDASSRFTNTCVFINIFEVFLVAFVHRRTNCLVLTFRFVIIEDFAASSYSTRIFACTVPRPVCINCLH